MTRQNYKIAYLTSINPRDKRALSGSPYYMLRALEKHVGSVDVLGPVKIKKTIFHYISQFFKKYFKAYNIYHSYFLARKYAKIFNKKLKGKNYDFIFAPRVSTEMCLIKTDIPIIYFTDTTFKLLYNYYEWFSGFMKISEWEGNKIEQLAINKASILINSSEWGANSAIKDYHADPEKVYVIPFAPNIDEVPERDKVLKPKDSDKCKLLFLGVEWIRKGGDIAFETLNELKKMGLNVSLTVCGCVPPAEYQDDDLIVIPFLNKNDKKQNKEFNKLLIDSHFLILPTREECFGVVFCEASAFGLPSITTDTGGISGAVKNGKNGFRLPLEARGKQYAEKIFEIFSDYENKYLPLSKSSRDIYEQKLNWDSWAASLIKILKEHDEIFNK
ncbi:MAG: glycosyltransferase family 4 protein [Bacteroidales bacterium]|nr:glycosyltransferase family 4 protein [Bacteroidales bacterium]